MRLLLFALFTIALPVSWGIAEFKAKPAVRRVIGLMALLWSFAVASFVGALQQLGADTFFSQASKDLLTASVEQLEAGRTEAVLREWSRADGAYRPSYEDREYYRWIVDRAIEGMKQP
jgi:hypothetical protein